MPRITMCIPTYTLNKNMEDMALTCADFYRDQVDELIISEDGGIFSEELRDMADVYIYNKENKGFSVNVNRAWKLSTGDYTMIVSSDTHLMSGRLEDLCIPQKVTSPEIVNQSIERLAGPFFVVPKEVQEERGMLLEEMVIYCSDSEMDHRVKDIFQKVPSVKIFHRMAQTVTPAGVEGGEQQRKDREIYERLIKEGKAAH